MGVAQPRYSALFPPSGDVIRTALLFPWDAGVGIEGVFLPPPLYYARTACQLFGAVISPSTVLPFRLLGQLVCGAYATPGIPLLLRAQLSTTVHLLSLPLPSCNMFLSLLVSASASPPYLWLLLSAAAEFVVASGLQPPPRSACLGVLLSFSDWAELGTVQFSSASAPPPGALAPFLPRSGFLGCRVYGRFLFSAQPVPAGATRLQMGPSAFSEDVTFLTICPLPLLMAYQEPTPPGSSMAAGMFLAISRSHARSA
jgi:hypothetical protein